MTENNINFGVFMKRGINSILLFLILVLSLFLSGCASLPIIESQSAGVDPYDGRYYFDVESNIAYSVKHDEDYLYLKLKTDDKGAIRKIMMHGLYVYFDPQGAKSKDIFFNYPLSAKIDHSKMREMQGGMSTGKQQEFDVNTYFERVSMEAIFSDHELAEKLPVFSSKTEFKVELASEGQDILVYYLRIPFDRISKNGLSDMSELSLGLMTGKVEMPQMGGGHSGGGMQAGGRSGGGMKSGGGRSNANDMAGSGERESMMQQLSIWFKVDLTPGDE